MKVQRMDIITILAANIRKENQKNWFSFLLIQKHLVAKHFQWLDLHINVKKRSLEGKGKIIIGGKSYIVVISYSPFYRIRYERIFVVGQNIKYNDDIHVYNDLSLCLYHPIDIPLLKNIPLYQMVPWVTEWLVFYEQWKVYGVWLGREIKHKSLN